MGKNWALPELLISRMEIGNRTVTEQMILAENDIMNNDDFWKLKGVKCWKY